MPTIPIRLVLTLAALVVQDAAPGATDGDPFASFRLPQQWQERFWADRAANALLDLDAKAIAALVPEQAGLKHCRCPKCGAAEAKDPLTWSIAYPDRLTCRQCRAALPDEHFPAKVGDKVPELVVEVLPRRFHRYPYHAVEADKALYPDERIYLAAKRDYEAREYLAKAAMYAALKYRETKDPKLARLASVLVLRFAQVYPGYATHFDRPGMPKFLDRADLLPPYRRAYGTAKWDWTGCLDVPMNLVVAYAVLRDDPALNDAGRALGDSNPRRTIERDLFRASAEFVRRQPEELDEWSLLADRGMLAVGRLLDDPILLQEVARRVDSFLSRGFYHDGVGGFGDGVTQKRIVGQLEGWIGHLLDPSSPVRSRIALAREAGAPAIQDGRGTSSDVDLQLASWPSRGSSIAMRRPALFGGAGIARLGVGQGADALDIELRGLGDVHGSPSGRLSIRLAVGGTPTLGDLDGESPTAWGFEYASASKSGLVIVDGLNQREALDAIRVPAPGSDIAFFAADPDFQVARFDDRFAYPKSAATYRHTVIASASKHSRIGVSVVEVNGGLQHDQVFHGAAGEIASWSLSAAVAVESGSLMPANVPFLAGARPEDGRWFVQAMGGFRQLDRAYLEHPGQATLVTNDQTGVRLHLLTDAPAVAFRGRSTTAAREGRPALVLRRRSSDGAALATSFVTVFEPLGTMPGLKRVGRLSTPPDVIAIVTETVDGTEYLVVNGAHGEVREVILTDNRVLRSDGLVTRLTPSGLSLAGGTFAEVGNLKVTHEPIVGSIVAAGVSDRPGAIGVFRVSSALPNPERLAGRILLIRHGDGSSRGWTIVAVENLHEGGARIHVREEAGLRIDPVSNAAKYERLPGTVAPGPHRFSIPRISR